MKKIISAILVIVSLFTLFFFSSRSVLKTLYPLTYSEFVETYTKENNLPKFLIFSVIECESGFDPNAVSYLGAKGLMQIMPETFLWLQTKTDEKLSEDRLFDPETSIRYGCLLYGILMREFDNNIETAAAAYHAGTGNVRKWLSDEKYSSDGVTLSNIPFSETKSYVEKVVKIKHIYEKLYS